MEISSVTDASGMEEETLGEAERTSRTEGGAVSPKSAAKETPDADHILLEPSPAHPKKDDDCQCSYGYAAASPKDGFRRRKKYERLPMYKRPSKEAHARNEPWLRQEDKATPYLGYLYHLAVGATLSVFSGNGIKVAADIPSYLGYFIIISTMWMIQMHYDLRFEANDAAHRIFKAGHIVLYLYIGASSRGWDLGKLAHDAGPDIDDKVDHDIAGDSFLAVGIAMAIHRAMMVCQYLAIVVLARKRNRRVTAAVVSGSVLTLTCVITVASVAIPADTGSEGIAKIALIYLAILIELLGLVVQVLWRGNYPVHGGELAAAYGQLSLNILGYGFSNLATAFQIALAGLAGTTTSTYTLVFLGIMYDMWVFLFAHFSEDDAVDSPAVWAWEVVHIPLHLAMLLLLFALVNVVIADSFIRGLEQTASAILLVFYWSFQGQDIPRELEYAITYRLSKLDLNDEFSAQFALLTSANVTYVNAEVLSYQLYARVLRASAKNSLLKLSDSTDDSIQALLELSPIANSTMVNSTDIMPSFNDTIHHMAITALENMFEDALAGILWIFPAAGFVLILCTARSWIRYRFEGPAQTFLHSFHLVIGVALTLLGLLDLGSKQVTVAMDHNNIFTLQAKYHNPLYHLFDVRMTLVIIFLVYTLLSVGAPTLMWVLSLRNRDWRWRRAARRIAKRAPGETVPASSHETELERLGSRGVDMT